MSAAWWNADWIWTATGWTLAGVGLVVFIWALFWDRSRGRKRCPKCWYDMSGAVAASPKGPWVCPECGRRFEREKALARTRVRWGLAVLALFAAAAGWIGVQYPVVQKRGWWYLVPTRAVIELLPLHGGLGQLGGELVRRAGFAPWINGDFDRIMGDEQFVELAERCARGNWLARPVDLKWRRSYGWACRRILGTWNAGFVENLPVPLAFRLVRARQALGDLAAPPTVRTRPVWPVGVPILLEVPVETWWDDYSLERWMRVRWTVEGSDLHGEEWCTGYTTFSTGATGHVRLHLDLDWVRADRTEIGFSVSAVLASASTLVEYTTAGSVDEVITPVHSAALDAAVAAAVHLEPGRDVLTGFRMDGLGVAGFDDVAFGLVLEFKSGEATIATCKARWLGGLNPHWTYGSFDSDHADGFDRVNQGIGRPGWSVRLRSDPAEALQVLGAKRFWDGEATIPLKANAAATPASPKAAEP